MVDAGAPTRSRRLPFWSITIALVISALGSVFLLLWFKLPTWAPAWVVEHSPWVDPIVRAVESPDDPLLERASERLAVSGPEIVPQLVSWVRQSDPSVRQSRSVKYHLATAAFAHVRDVRLIEPMTMAIHSWDGHPYPQHLVNTLSVQDPTLVTDHLLPHLVTGRLVRQALLDVAGSLPDERLIPLLTAIMVQSGTWGTQDVRGPFRESAEVAAEALVNSPCRSAIPTLIEAFTGGNETIRRRVVDGISHGKWMYALEGARDLDERLEHLLLVAIDDPVRSVRCVAARIMCLLPIPGSEERLIRMSRVMDSGERRCAIFGLHPKWHGESARKRIVEALHDEDDVVRLEAIEVLDRMDRSYPTSELLDLLSSPNAVVRMSACYALRKVDRTDPRVFPAFVKLIGDPENGVSSAAHYLASSTAHTPEMKAIVEERVRAQRKRSNDDNPFGLGVSSP